MKKFFVLGIMFLFICTMSFPAFAAEVPFVPGDGCIVGDTEDENSIAAENLKQREIAYNEILALSKEDKNITAVELSKDGTLVFVEIPEGDGSIERAGEMKEYAKRFIEQYGDFVMVTNNIKAAQEEILTADGLELGGGNKANNPLSNPWMWSVCALLLMGAASVVFFKRGIRIPALQTANGNIMTQNTGVSAKETISAIKKSETTPDKNVFDSILQRIDKENQ